MLCLLVLAIAAAVVVIAPVVIVVVIADLDLSCAECYWCLNVMVIVAAIVPIVWQCSCCRCRGRAC